LHVFPGKEKENNGESNHHLTIMIWMMHVASDDVPQHYPLEDTVFGLFW
jgi:hypothetical protein